jgi:general secretion pathway protein D
MLAGLLGCSTAQETAHDGEKAVEQQNWDAAVYHYLEAVTDDPGNIEYRMQLGRARQKASQAHLRKGLMLGDMGRLHDARNELRMAAELDPVNQFAEQALEKVQEELEILAGPGGEQALEEMKRRAAEAKVKPPILDPTSKEPITLKFPQPKPVKEIYKALGKAYGFNVLFDPKLKDDKLSVELNDVTAERALEIVLQAAGHFYKVLDEHSIIVAEDTPQNRREYEDLVIKTFFLSNAEVKDIDKLLRALIEARRLATNEQLNTITLRDTADKVAIAEKLIHANDKAKAEVLVDVELMLMATTKDSDLGMTLSTYSFTLGVDTGAIQEGSQGNLFLDQLSQISSGNTFINIPSLVVNLAKSSGRAEVLAQPQLRITDGEKAKLHIGDKYPIPVTSFNSGNNVGGNVVPITSFQYQDIGIRIEVEPRVHHNREITLKLSVEISNIGETVTVGPSQEAVVIGTRTITSVNRLKDGETSLLAGLFRNDMTEGVVETPGLSQIPLIGRLFTNKAKKYKRTDLVLTVTPHIVRFPDINEEDLAPLWVGTESRISFYGGNSPRVASGSGSRSPFDARKPPKKPDPRQRNTRDDDGKPKESPFHTPSTVRPRQLKQPRGVELAGGGTKALDLEDGDAGGTGDTFGEPFGLDDVSKPAEIDSGGVPIQLTLQPSVISMAVDQKAQIQIVGSGDYDNYRLPVMLTFDPQRIAIDGVETPPAIAVIDQVVDAGQGLISLDLVVPDGDSMPQVLASISVRALTPGSAPLIFNVQSIRKADGTTAPVSASDGAIFITNGAGN